jgi:glyoxylase-like metal-dependent hydrolase (beta-lactamase superfamily II)/rhodanese-related sulfurtransferase
LETGVHNALVDDTRKRSDPEPLTFMSLAPLPAGMSEPSNAVSPDELAEAIESGEPITLLDVRNRDEVDAWRIEGPNVESVHVPYMQFVSANVTGEVGSLVDPDESYVVVCPRGEESAEVVEMLENEGIDARNLAGGMAGWADVYRRREVGTAATDATVFQYHRPATGCLGYAVVDGGEMAVVDPLAAFSDRYVEDAAALGAEIVAVVDTHVHADHVSGLREVADAAGLTPSVPSDAVDRGIEYAVDAREDGDAIGVGGTELAFRASPGHTTGSMSLLIDDVLLSGDSLFLDGVGRPDLQGGDADPASLAAELHATLTERFADLPDETLVAPGHVRPETAAPYTAELGELRTRLSAFSEPRAAFVDRIVESVGEPPANHDRIVAINLGREAVDGAAAFELELGPNNCAVAD